MKYLKLFENFQPNDKQVDNYLLFLEERYPIKDSEFGRYIIVDEKPCYLKFGKGRATDKIFYEIINSEEMEESVIHNPSLRKAIKIYISK